MYLQKDKNWKSILLVVSAVITNVVLIILVVFSVVSAINTADENSTAQNVANIRTLTEASADKVSIEIGHSFDDINELADFINNYNGTGMSETEITSYFTEFYAESGEADSWLIVDRVRSQVGTAQTYCFYGIVPADALAGRRQFLSTVWTELAQIFATAGEDNLATEPKFSREVTEPVTTELGFFLTATIRIRQTNGSYDYKTLAHFVETNSLLSLIVSNSSSDTLYYEGYSGTIVGKDGDYIVSADAFQETNFCEYFALYNESFTRQTRDALLEKLNSANADATHEPLYYVNNEYKDCIFTLAPISGTEWYVLSVAPVDSFRITYDFNRYFMVFALFFAALFVIDIIYAVILIMSLRLHMKLEKEANAAKGSFMSRMSHEIRTPLNAIIGYSLLASTSLNEANSEQERIQASVKVLDCLNKSNIASKQLLSIINDVLDMSAIDSGKITISHDRFDFKGLITSLTTIFYSQAKAKGISFDVILETMTAEWFIGDQMRINQVITNLLSNAIKFTPEGGSVRLTITQPEAEDNAAHVHFEVSDTGIGMTQAYLDRIWTPFEQADSSISRRFGGSGLGLSITKNLVDLMGGTINVRSAIGEGTTFIVDLTLEETSQPHADSILYDFSTINTLIVDDDVTTCEYMRSLFNRFGARSAAVTSGMDAIKAVQNSVEAKDPFSLCLVDWYMPKMDGIETIRHIREVVGADLPIIVITAYDYTEIVDKAKEYGVVKCISKPLFQSTLFDLLTTVCGKETIKHVEKSTKNDFGGARVLLAEDNEMNMEIAKRLMESAGLVVDSAWNGEEAVNKFLSTKKDTYIAILMDVHMPIMDGYTATKEIRRSAHAEAKTIPIIAMTADAFSENVAEALAVGMDAHIAKPIDVQILFDKLTEYHQKKYG